MRRRFWVGCVAVMGLSVPSMAGAGEKDNAKARSMDVERILSAGREDSQVMDHLDVLCNRIGPRLTSSDNLTNACEWVRDRFASFGIENARLEPWGEFPVGFNRGPWFGRVIEPESRALEFATMAWTAGTKGAVRGKAVLAPKDQKELDEAKAKGTLAGAWVLWPVRSSGGSRRDPAFLRALRKELEDAKAAGIVERLVRRAAGDQGHLPDLLGQAADPTRGHPRCASSSRKSPPGSRTARPSPSSSTSATTSRRARSRSTT